MTGQFTQDRLPTSELLPLGGDAYGRAFTQSAIMGDSGAAAALEFALRAPPSAASRFNGSELYGFADYAQARINGRYGFGDVERELASTGLGMRVAWRETAVAGLEVAYAAKAPQHLRHDEWRLGFNLRAVR